jgi:hypothetical protein
VGRRTEKRKETAVEGYKVVTADDKELGEVVGRIGDSVVIEHGLLRKKKHAVPLAFASTDDDERIIRTTLSKEMIEASPHVDDNGIDETQIAIYYGLAEAEDAPATEGYGELGPDETAITSDRQARSDGLITPEEERAQIREGLSAGEGPLDRDESPGITGGDRFRDAER